MTKIHKLIIVSLFICLLSVASIEAAPSILTYNNSISDDTLYPHQQVNTDIQFNVTIDEAVNYTWIKDGTSISNNYNNYTTQWTGPGQKNITVYGANVNGSTAQLTWYPKIEQEMAGAGDVVSEIDTAPYDSIMEVLGSEDPNYETLLFALAMPHVSILGSLFYVILYGVPFLFMWVSQGSAKMPAILGCMLAPVMLGAFNPDYIGLSILMIILVLFGVVYTMYKSRGT